MIGVSQTFVSRLLKIEPGEFILVGFPKQFCTEAHSPLDSGLGLDVMRVLPVQQPRVGDVDEINKELCSQITLVLAGSRCTVLWKADTGLDY